MTRFELITMNQTLLKTMAQNAISPKEADYIDMMIEYKEMRAKHHKVTYVVCHLSQKYNLTERTVFNIVKKMSARVKM